MDDFFSARTGHRVSETQHASYHSITVGELTAKQKIDGLLRLAYDLADPRGHCHEDEPQTLQRLRARARAAFRKSAREARHAQMHRDGQVARAARPAGGMTWRDSIAAVGIARAAGF